EYLKSKEIHTQVHYIPVHEQPFYIGRYGRQSFPNSEAHYRECLSLPMYPTLSEVQQERVICEVKNFFDKKNG
ncbi:UDP-4-amino-4,6-dideoxy-N-acetyl-beta-L-altrosamine transaminase, partial [bacterium]|nr:UDP-4-amino-4,6-dideoxy-N-acetyl-beta-L-altrosamine transaminase [bacterium]